MRCGFPKCGVPTSRSAAAGLVHVEPIPKGTDDHDAVPYVDAPPTPPQAPNPAQQTADALTRIADAAEWIVSYLAGDMVVAFLTEQTVDVDPDAQAPEDKAPLN